jgi:dCMP deaminase
MVNHEIRPTWHEYFLMLAKLAATRSTCLSFPVGAVIVRDRQLLATGYNGPPSKSAHCTELGYCYEGLSQCSASKVLPSRAVHAEANAIAQAAKNGISTAGASIYVTLEPCLSCLKLIISAGIGEVFYETPYEGASSQYIRDLFTADHLVVLTQITLREETAALAASFILHPLSVEDELRRSQP